MAQPQRLGKYELLKRIATGGMAEIFLASQGGLEGFERAVIVKCIREDLLDEREVLEMFLDEARVAACLKHANIVHLYDVGVDRRAGVPYLAMEYIFGRDMAEIADQARSRGWELPVSFMVKVLGEALAGLHYAHQVAEFEGRPLNMIHRDVSPQNIIVSFDGTTKLVDFGISKAEARLSETRAGVLKGKYAYMSPEQVRGKPLDHRSDQFSLAVVFYELLTATRLFQRDTDYSTMEAVDHCEIPPMKVLRKDVPRRLIRALRKALRKNPRRRFKSCMEMERYLHRLQRGSLVERNQEAAQYLRRLFAQELDARSRAIDNAPEQEREVILSCGFEMLERGATRIDPLPEPPLAQRRYQEILAERQAQKTKVKTRAATPTPVVRDRLAAGQARPPAEATARRKNQRGPMGDWRFLLAVFVAAAFLGLFLLNILSDQSGTRQPQPGPSRPAAALDVFRPGLDGFLSVSVAPRVRVFVGGRELGTGAFRKQPLERGVHLVLLHDLQSGGKREFSVNIEADQEAFLAPADFQ